MLVNTFYNDIKESIKFVLLFFCCVKVLLVVFYEVSVDSSSPRALTMVFTVNVESSRVFTAPDDVAADWPRPYWKKLEGPSKEQRFTAPGEWPSARWRFAQWRENFHLSNKAGGLPFSWVEVEFEEPQKLKESGWVMLPIRGAVGGSANRASFKLLLSWFSVLR